VRMLDREGFATSLAARYDPRRREITFASAGHPGPLLRHADGRIDDLTTTGLLLGMRYGKSSATSTVPIPDGAMLVFYTDGLVEATRDFAKGQRRLLESLGRAELPSAPNPARALVTGVLRGKEAGDDIAVLVVAFDHESAAKSL
jgi:serine phosphatase RsbU (regulator of sigma subunit)